MVGQQTDEEVGQCGRETRRMNLDAGFLAAEGIAVARGIIPQVEEATMSNVYEFVVEEITAKSCRSGLNHQTDADAITDGKALAWQPADESSGGALAWCDCHPPLRRSRRHVPERHVRTASAPGDRL